MIGNIAYLAKGVIWERKDLFFIGHRAVLERIYSELAQTVKQIIEQGVEDFCMSYYGNLECLVTRAAIAAK